jgi:regulator of protease activity HflC (stomatin/prohibitin superfamily)
LTERAGRFNLVLDDVSITHVAFSQEFTHAVEAKQVAQQTALRAAYLVDQAIQEKQVSSLRATLLPIMFFSSVIPSSQLSFVHKERPVVLS